MLYAKAISLGATCAGEPGLRVPDVFYSAYVRDAERGQALFLPTWLVAETAA